MVDPFPDMVALEAPVNVTAHNRPVPALISKVPLLIRLPPIEIVLFTAVPVVATLKRAPEEMAIFPPMVKACAKALLKIKFPPVIFRLLLTERFFAATAFKLTRPVAEAPWMVKSP